MANAFLLYRPFVPRFPAIIRAPPFTVAAAFSSISRPPPAASLPARIELEQTQVAIQGRVLTVVQPKDVDQVLDMYIEQGRLDGDPYWCRLWPSAIILAEEILRNPQLVTELHVCDLGCGLGLAGLAALLAGAKEVEFYDQEPLALLCSLLSVHATIPHAATNLSFIMKCFSADKIVESSEGFPWRSGLSLNSAESLSSGTQDTELQEGLVLRATAELFDWADSKVQAPKFDMVLACDVLYEKKSVPCIAKVLPKLLCHGSGKVIMTDPTHRTPQNRQQLLDLLSQNTSADGLKLEKHDKRTRKTNAEASDQVELMQFVFS